MVEAELKARVRNPEQARQLLRQRAPEEAATYADTYYDDPDQQLHRTGRELRLRTITTARGACHLLTFKEAAVDAASQSKPEHETEVAEPEPVAAMLHGLGLAVWVRLTKHVLNYRFSVDGREVLASLVTVPELDGSFLEVETMTEPDDLDAGLALVRRMLAELGIDQGDVTTERYDESVLRRRAAPSAP